MVREDWRLERLTQAGSSAWQLSGNVCSTIGENTKGTAAEAATACETG